MNNTILVAGIGNIFHRDDAFGVVVASKLADADLPPNVRVREFGIRGFDLGMELLDDPSLVILVDAISRGGSPGTLYTLEVDWKLVSHSDAEFQNAHGLDPARALAIAQQLGAHPLRVLVVGCEPETLEDATGTIGLTPPVDAAVGPAIEMIHRLIEEQNQSWSIQAPKTEVCV